MKHADEPDLQLYEAWERGDLRAADTLIARHLRSVGRFFANKVGNPSDAEDLTCKVFEICARKLGTFERRSAFRTYVFGIAHNLLRDYVKSKRHDKTDVDFDVDATADLGPSPSCALAQRKERVLLLRALRAIPLTYQIAIELSFVEGLTRAEIAELLGVPEGTIASRLRRGRIALEDKLAELAESTSLLESTRRDLADWVAGLPGACR